jgi:hypothetical protein
MARTTQISLACLVILTAACGSSSSSKVVTVSGISINKSQTSLLMGGSEQLEAFVSPANASNQSITWETSDTAIASVSPTGLVAGVASGMATISATAQDGKFTARCWVMVSAKAVAVTGVSLRSLDTPDTIVAGSERQLAVVIMPSNATNQSVSWESSDTSIATVSPTGLVTGVAPGTTTISVTTADGRFVASLTVTVVSTPPPAAEDEGLAATEPYFSALPANWKIVSLPALDVVLGQGVTTDDQGNTQLLDKGCYAGSATSQSESLGGVGETVLAEWQATDTETSLAFLLGELPPSQELDNLRAQLGCNSYTCGSPDASLSMDYIEVTHNTFYFHDIPARSADTSLHCGDQYVSWVLAGRAFGYAVSIAFKDDASLQVWNSEAVGAIGTYFQWTAPVDQRKIAKLLLSATQLSIYVFAVDGAGLADASTVLQTSQCSLATPEACRQTFSALRDIAAKYPVVPSDDTTYGVFPTANWFPLQFGVRAEP